MIFTRGFYKAPTLKFGHSRGVYRVSQNSRIPNSERGREGHNGARKILRKKTFPVLEEDISTLIF
jgi:hypothetical protein